MSKPYTAPHRQAALDHADGGLWSDTPTMPVLMVLTEIQKMRDAAGDRIPKPGARVTQAEIDEKESVFWVWDDVLGILKGEIQRRSGAWL